jgi:tetratricopeptide (TPR) repeat protein
MRSKLLFLIWLLSIPLHAIAQQSTEMKAWKPEARAHLERGLQLYDRNQLDEAIAELKAGHAIDPHPEFLYALGQVHRKKGDCAEAVKYYQAFVDAGPPAHQVAMARDLIDKCKRAAEPPRKEAAPPPLIVPDAETPQPPATLKPPTPAPPPPPPPSVEAPHVEPPAIQRGPMPWYRDWLGDALTGAGLIALTVGGVVVLDAQGKIDDAQHTYGNYAMAREGDAEGQRTMGTVVMGLGGALVAGGVLRYWLHPSSSESEVAVSLSPGMLFLAGRF